MISNENDDYNDAGDAGNAHLISRSKYITT